MSALKLLVLAAALAFGLIAPALAQETNLLPKYGSSPKNEAMLEADKRFVAYMQEQFKGDLKEASKQVAMVGWQHLRKGDPQAAMRRFNQAWLLDAGNGHAVWGMAAAQSTMKDPVSAMPLFEEAAQSLADDTDFSVDYARQKGLAGMQTRNMQQIDEAMGDCAKIFAKAPQHVMNLQNWAILNFVKGDYAEAWKKIELAEAAPRANGLDQSFIAALQGKMPRPAK